MRKFIIAGFILIPFLFTVGCKKSDSSTTNKPSISGLTMSTVAPYLAVGTEITLKADISGLTTTDGKDPGTIGIYWQVNSAKKDTLSKDISKSNPTFTYKADTLGSYAVFCYAYAAENTDYYASSASISFRTINPDTALSGVTSAEEITVNGITWKARNATHATLGRSYRNSPILDNALGRLFTWEDAQNVCPAGWHLPTVAEFEASFADEVGDIPTGDLMADAVFLDEKMWTYWPQVTINNKYGFNALPLGYIDYTDLINTFDNYGEYAMWWTADHDDDMATYLYIFEENEIVMKGQGDKYTLAMGVRCVKD